MQLEQPLTNVMCRSLQYHLEGCKDCRSYLNDSLQLEETLRNLPSLSAPENFTSDLLAKLPKQRRKTVPSEYLSPRIRALGATAALAVLLGSPLYMLVESPRPTVKSTDLNAQFYIVENTVFLPEGAVVRGDITVYNAKLLLAGRVEGTILLMSSDLTTESTGCITGTVQSGTWSWFERLKFGLDQIRQDAKSYVKGALK